MELEKKIITQININQLNGLDLNFVIAQLCVLNNKPFKAINEIVDKLLQGKKLILNSLNEVFVQDENSSFASKSTNKSKFLQNVKPKLRERDRLQGKVIGTRGSYAFFAPFNADLEDVFIAPKNLNGALNGDTVEIELLKRKKGFEAEVKKIIERANQKIVGIIEMGKAFAVVKADDVKFGKDILIPHSKTLKARDGQKVVVVIEKHFGNHKMPEGAVIEVLGDPNNIDVEVMSIIRTNNLYETFPKKVEAKAAEVSQTVDLADYPNRLDLTKDLLFTIDGADARDLDDAVSLTVTEDEGYVLGVHIADVGEYVKLHSEIDNEAFKRATSVYFPNLVLPMLPKVLSNGICSLNEMQNRLALSAFITFNKHGDVQKYSFHESVIKSKRRFTYDEVEAILQGDKTVSEKNKDFVATLLKMNELSKKLIKKRNARGAIDFDLPEVKISLNNLGDVLNVEQRERFDAHRLIESFMIAANEAVAEHFFREKLPFVYRIHEKPDAIKMQAFTTFLKSFGVVGTFSPDAVKPKDLQNVLQQISDENVKYIVNRIALRSLKKAKYYPQCLGHFGLASTYYAHFTSPIRRYPDLTIHRFIKLYLRNQLKGNKLNEAKQFAIISSQVSSDREVLAERVERDVDDLYKAFYMSYHIGEEFEGRISSVTDFGIYVELKNTVEGLVKLFNLPTDEYTFNADRHELKGRKAAFKIGQEVKVRAVRADILAREIDFVLVEDEQV